ncbi:MAG: acetyl-CoA carboxylase biotin carboxyl carrier protein subunit [Alicyclobacillus herbarius]|uniref:acetyl-CoA carboxylase biotin carboxyl carrier protein subunit n=1 Tax=Alicyclobacillus herbarius TaxID=122960 RepID=UPI0023536F07|nr:acetyl-CoA carboxylase biotin carboxyl carrier protein subunit [Alicyclobacillus herbarius]MCL6631704.1 acetyl-CoA carboxylase biotin carboxyl carrier protein subunit [Alicyclobacillus herbarius]
MTNVVAPMAGTVLNVLVQTGDRVAQGSDVVVLESMKMEIPVPVDVSGTVQTIRVAPGDFVNEGDTLLELFD